eukprot:6977763-Pyramimonas_sp.AAC.1
MGGPHGVNAGDVPVNAKISGHPNALDLPGHLPFTVGAAVAGEGGGGLGGQGDDRRDDRSTAPSTGVIVALQFDEAGKSKQPRGPPGGPGGDGDPGGDGGGGPNGHDGPAWRPFHANQMDIAWRGCANNKEWNLLDIPSVQTLREWMQHCMRALAGSRHDVRAAQTW